MVFFRKMADFPSEGVGITELPNSPSPPVVTSSMTNGDMPPLLVDGGGMVTSHPGIVGVGVSGAPFPSKKGHHLNRLNSAQATFANEKMNAASAHSQVMSSASSRLAKRSQLMQHSMSTEMKTSASSTSTSSTSAATTSSASQELKSNLSELKSSISEMKSAAHQFTSSQQTSTSESRNFSRGVSVTVGGASGTGGAGTPGGGSICDGGGGSSSNGIIVTSPISPVTTNPMIAAGFLRGSIEELDMDDPAVVSSGDSDGSSRALVAVGLASPNLVSNVGLAANAKEMKFEQKRMTQASKTKIMTDKFSAEKATANASEMKRVQAGDMSYEEKSAAAAVRAKLEVDGMTAEKSAAVKQEQRSLKAGDITQQENRSASAASMKLQSDTFSAEKMAVAAQQQRQTVTSTGIFNQEKHMAASTQSKLTITAKGVCTKAQASSSSMVSSSQTSTSSSSSSSALVTVDELLALPAFDDLEMLNADSNPRDVEQAIMKYSGVMSKCVDRMKRVSESEAPSFLNRVNEIMRKAWAVPTHGHELGYSLCNVVRNNGGLDVLIQNCTSFDEELQFSSARLLEQCLTTENRGYVVDKGLETVVNVACVCTSKVSTSVDHSRVGTGILEHLFKHSEGTCSDVIRLGGLDAVLFECRKNDVETLRHCAGALANLSLYGGAENQEAMIKRKVPMWLFPLAFHNDDNIKYYACLAIAVLVANKEIEAAVLKSGTLNLVEPFVTTHNPSEFAASNLAHAHGQSKNWLQRLVPVLSSKREEARNLAAFHFCMEAGIKKKQGNTDIFREIGAIEPLKKVASSPNAIASKCAAQALRLIGEEVPHKLSQQVPLWSIEDVREWVKQIGFSNYANDFVESRVDGDLLLQLTEEMLRDDITIKNGILRKRFMRELRNLKKMADYSSCDTTNLNAFLLNICTEYSMYTYSLLNAGVDKDVLRCLHEDQLLSECGINSSIHRLKIGDALRVNDSNLSTASDENLDKSLDVFVSYRRSNGSQLASLLKVHLQLRGFSVFIDVERLEAGKFDNNLLQSIRQAKHFLLVLTPSALDRCIQDTECKDWVHREIVAALQSQCNIIPIIDNFQWPEPEELPEDMRAVCYFNGVRWIHDYQDACVDKLERFMRGEMNVRSDGPLGRYVSGLGNKGDATPGTPSTVGRHPVYQRTQSTESGKGSSCSDKDLNGNCNGPNGTAGGKD